MALYDQIRQDLTGALKAGEQPRLGALRLLVSAIGYKRIDLGRDLSDDEVVGVIRAEAKKRREAIASYRVAARTNQAKLEEMELAILQAYLPKLMTDEEIRRKVQSSKVQGDTDFPTLMKKVMAELKGKADGALVARIVKEIVNG